MINLAYRDIAHGFGRYLATGLGLGLLIGVTLTMAGVYRGMVEDGLALLQAADADVWVVQQHTLGPFAEPFSLSDEMIRGVLAMPGVRDAGNVAYLTMEVIQGERSVRVMMAGYEPGRPGGPDRLIEGRFITRNHYEMVADVRTGFRIGDRVPIRRHDYTVVGITKGLRSSGGDPMVFVSLKDAQEIQFLKDNDAIFRDRKILSESPVFNPPGNPNLLEAVEKRLFSNHRVNAILVRLQPGYSDREVAATIQDWLRLTAYTRAEMEEILIGQLIATAAKQIGLFLVILTLVSAAIVALTIYSMTQTKLKEIAVLKLIGTPNRRIAGMIVQESIGLGFIGFLAGKLAVTYWAPLFPKHVVILERDTLTALAITLAICLMASFAGVRAALRVSPASAIGG